jgi:pimeloyl-ACP methyl ester carboxylesterase
MALVPIARGQLYYEETGTGQPLLLLPGLGLDHTYYRRLLPNLTKEFAVLTVDPRGIGKSSKNQPPYSVESWAEDFAQMIEALGRGPMHILGSSLGGAMALVIAARYPQRVKSLVVVGAFTELDRAARLNFELRARLVHKLGLGDEVADYQALWTMTREFINSDEGYAQMQANQKSIRENDAETYLEFIRAVLRWGRCLPGQETEPKFTESLRKIAAPTLVVSSDDDQLIPLAASEIIAKAIPGAKLAVMHKAGHIIVQEHPRELAELAMSFLRGNN